jgi:hypothetical protein
VQDASRVLEEAFIGAEVEGSSRGRQRDDWRWWGASMASVVSALKGGSGEDGAEHHFEERRAGGTVDLASLGTKESVGGIGSVATPVEGGGSCNCSGKKNVKAYFRFFTFSKVRYVSSKGTNAEAACLAQRPNGPTAAVEK